MKKQDGDMKVGVAWYAETEWQKLRDVAADPETLETNYADWLKVFNDGLRDLTAAGIVAERVEVNVVELQAWCQQQGCLLDGGGRSAFAAELLRRRYEGPGGGRRP